MVFSCEKREIYFGVMMVHDVAGRSKSFSGRYERPERRRLRRGLSNVSLWLDYIIYSNNKFKLWTFQQEKRCHATILLYSSLLSLL